MNIVKGEPLIAVNVRLTDAQKDEIRQCVSRTAGTTLIITSACGGPDTIMMTKSQLTKVGSPDGVFFAAEQLEAICPQIVATLSVTLNDEQKACITNARRELRGIDLEINTAQTGSDKVPVTRRMLREIADAADGVAPTLFFSFEHLNLIVLSGVMNASWMKPVKPHVERASNAASSAFGGAFGAHAGRRLGENLFGYTGVKIFNR